MRGPQLKKRGPKLSPLEISRVRAAREEGIPWKDLEKRFGVSERLLRELTVEGGV